MKRTLKVLLGAAALAVIGVSTATAQTGPLLGKELYLFDGGTGSTQNQIRLVSPVDATLTTNWTLTLPPTAGGMDYILVNTDGAGSTEWQDGNGIFWRLNGNTGTTPWDGATGNYYGTGDATDLALRAGGSNMKFWFGAMTFPVMTLNQYGAVTLQTADGYNGLVIGGQPGGITGPDAGIVLDCALPPSVGIEVNALATGILMPTCPLTPAPLVGISLKAQNTGIEIDDAPTGLYITDATTGINVTGSTRSINATGTVRLNTVALDASATQVLARNASNDVVYRSIAATGTIVTTPTGGTVNTLPLWSPSSSELGNSIITQDAGATTATVGGILSVTGNTSLQGTLTIDVADVALSPAHVRVLTQSAAGLVGYRTIPANGDIVVSNGPLTNNGAVYTNSTGQLQSVALTNGQILIGSNGNAPVANTLTAGAGVTITNGAGSIMIAVTNPNPAGTTNNSTLRWNTATTSWQENVNLLATNAGDVTANGSVTLGNADADVHTIRGATSINTTGGATTSIGSVAAGAIDVFSGANIALNSTSGDITLAATDVAINSSTGVTINTLLPAPTTIGTNNVASVTSLASPTIDISNVPTNAASSNLLRRNASGDIEVSTASVAVIPGGTLAANRNVRTDGSGGLTVGAIALNGGSNEVTGILPVGNGGTGVDGSAAANGTLLIGNGTGYTLATLTAGTGISITNGAGSITIAASGELLPAGPNTTDATLRWDGSDWVQNVNLLSTAAGNTTINGTTTLNGTVTVDPADVAADASDTRILSFDGASGLLGYRTIPANGDIVTSNGALGNNSAVRTNGSGQLETVALTNGQILIGSNAAAPVAATLTAGTGISITNAAGSITIATSNEQLPNGTTNHATLRWDGSDWVENTLFLADNTGGLFNNSLSAGANTDNLLTIDAAGNFHETSVATMLGGTPWVLGGNTSGVTGTNNILGINYASGEALRVFVEGFNPAAWATTGKLTQFNDFQVDENTTLGDNDDDALTIRATTNINATNLAALNTNISTSAQTNVTTIGNALAGNNTVLNSATITVPNIPAAASATTLIVRDGSNNLGTRTIGSGTNIITGSGTNNTLTKWTSANTIGDGSITDDGTTVEFSTANVEMPNLPNDVSTSTWIVTYNNATGGLEKKNLGAPIQKVKSGTATITGAPPTRVFSVADTFIATGATVTVTLQDGTDVNDYTVTLPAGSITNGVGFTIRLSGVMGAGNTKTVHYTITNP